MSDIELHIPSNSLFHSSLNEIDLGMREIYLREMRRADPRNKLRKQDILATDEANDWLWDYSRVFQVDELDIEEIFDTYLLRKKINNTKGVDISYPILAYAQNDLETVFWNTGQRHKQWYLETDTKSTSWSIGSIVGIIEPAKYRGLRAKIETIEENINGIYCTLTINNETIKERDKGLKFQPVKFSVSNLKLLNENTPDVFHAKPITGTYNAVILVDNRDEAQYIRDKFILRCSSHEIWHRFKSPTINNSENQIFTVFGIPNLEKYPTSKDKLDGQGYIYGVGFQTTIWSCLTDEPLPQSYIDNIRMSLHVEKDGPVNRIVIN